MDHTPRSSHTGEDYGKRSSKKRNSAGTKPRSRRKKRPTDARTSSGFNLSSVAVTLAAIILCVYVYAFVRTIQSLPQLETNDTDQSDIIKELEQNAKLVRVSGVRDKKRFESVTEGQIDPVLDKYQKRNEAPEITEEDDGFGRIKVQPSKDFFTVGADDDQSNSHKNQLRGNTEKEDNSNALFDAVLPKSKWPVSIMDEENNFEDIVHPGDHKTVLSVPKFWSGPLTGEDGKVGSLMSRDLATRFGSYTNGSVDTDYRNKGNRDERTIFVAIASYRDWQCRYTVESILTRAKFPNRIRIVVVDQMEEGDLSCGEPIEPCEEDPHQGLCKFADLIDVFQVDDKLAVGPVFARHIGIRMYRGEYYAMQIDAHVTFVQDWDVDIINQIESTNNEMAVMSTYLTDIVDSIDEATGKSKRRTRPIMCNTDFEGGQGKHLRHGSQPEAQPTIKGSPQMQPFWAAGWSFSRGHFVVNVPYDLNLPMIFMGEECSIGIRGFTYGYDHYAPERSVCFHTYANGKNRKGRSKVKNFWEHAQLYSGEGIRAMKRLNGIIGMNPEVDVSEWDHTDEKLYGLGSVRKSSDFYDTFGINVVEKVVQPHLCKFVSSGRMHRQFLPYLRSNGMGLDYNKINFKYTDSG